MRLPELLALHDVGGLIAHAVGRDTTEGEALKVLAKEEGDRQSLSSLFERYPSCLRMLVVVGPEGGWSKREIEQFAEAGFYTVHLGPRTLRLETAAVALLAAAQLLWGDLGVGRE
jgi:RsmE family RNA methyltransferase